jgi:hypothetical protein
MGVRTNLHAPQLISRVLKLTTNRVIQFLMNYKIPLKNSFVFLVDLLFQLL